MPPCWICRKEQPAPVPRPCQCETHVHPACLAPVVEQQRRDIVMYERNSWRKCTHCAQYYNEDAFAGSYVVEREKRTPLYKHFGVMTFIALLIFLALLVIAVRSERTMLLLIPSSFAGILFGMFVFIGYEEWIRVNTVLVFMGVKMDAAAV